MLKKISNEQLKRLALHSAGISNVLLEAALSSDEPDWKQGMTFDEIIETYGAESGRKEQPCGSMASDFDIPFEPLPAPVDWQEEERLRREQAMNRLCGRWTMGNNRCGIEITRAGEHFVLTYLKRNGYPTDERYVLIWLDGDILYYGREHRITMLALNTESDTLMVSPGADYTRQPEE